VTHIRWTKKDYVIQIGQSKTAIAIKITPIRSKTLGIENTTESKRIVARTLCSRILNDEADIKTNKPPSFKVRRNIKAKLLTVSFDDAPIEELYDGVCGVSRRLDFKDKSDRIDYNYWWRRLNWYTNGKSVGLYTIKYEGGPLEVNFYLLDDDWFEKPTYTRKRKESHPKN
jgi:hypothetical protein